MIRHCTPVPQAPRVVKHLGLLAYQLKILKIQTLCFIRHRTQQRFLNLQQNQKSWIDDPPRLQCPGDAIPTQGNPL